MTATEFPHDFWRTYYNFPFISVSVAFPLPLAAGVWNTGQDGGRKPYVVLEFQGVPAKTAL